MKKLIALVAICLFSTTIALQAKDQGAPVTSKLPILLPDENPAMNDPDRYNWGLFVLINKKADQQSKVGADTTNNAIWETWADDPLTFPATPDPKTPPVWPQNNAKKLEPTVKQQFREMMLNKRMELRENKLDPRLEASNGGSEEVRRNKSAFDFIVANNLWYRQGLQAMFASGKRISFPVDAIEIKATWTSISPADKSKYHWNYDGNGKLFGLTGLHIMSKAVPNWTWATWEWVGNPGRGDYIGCHDSFGAVDHDVAPKTPLGQVYPAGDLTPALLEMFKEAGIPDEWKNYRLKGSQTEFTEPTGKITLLGNSIAEKGFVQTSSCMTCHSQASVDASGLVQPSIGFTPDGQSTNGAPLPSWFFNTNTTPWTRTYEQVDFVWAVLRARPAKVQ